MASVLFGSSDLVVGSARRSATSRRPAHVPIASHKHADCTTFSGVSTLKRSNRTVGVACRSSAQFTPESENPNAPQIWGRMAAGIRQAGVRCISSDDLVNAQQNGAVVLDVRPEAEWEEIQIEDSINIPLYQPIEGWSPYKIARRVGYAAFGVFNGTELNEQFLEAVMEAAEPNQTLVLVCGIGGSLEKTAYYENGQPTRSLIAAHELIRNGFTNVRVLKNGISGWEEEGRELFTLNYEDGEETEELEEKE